MRLPSVRNRATRVLTPLLLAVATLLSVTCSQMPEGPVRLGMLAGDRERDWGSVYYHSWRQDRKTDYLVLARRHTAESVRQYLALQARLGHSYPDFYDLDRRRLEGCLFLKQIDREAVKYRVLLEDQSRDGCYR